MKHIKNFNLFLKESSEHGFSILSIFKPFANLISNLNINRKLNILIHEYDNYLYNVYIEYLSRREKINQEELKKSNIGIIDKDNQISDDTEDVDNSKENNVSDINNTNTLSLNGTNSYFNLKPSSKSFLNMNSIDISSEEAENFSELMDEYIESGNIIDLKEEKREYELAYNNDSEKLRLCKMDLNNYIKTKKKYLNDILDYERGSEGFQKLTLKIDSYNKNILDLDKKIKKLNDKIKQHKWFVDETTKVIKFIEQNKKSTSSIKETKSWKDGAQIDLTWTPEDMDNVNDLINPFQIEEFHLKADIIINSSDDTKKVSNAKSKWSMYLNSLYKKWYFTFDVKKLRNITPNTQYKKGKDKYVIQKEFAHSTIILEELFNGIKSYTSPFKKLENDNNNYFIILTKTNMFLLKKIIFNNNIYNFQLLSTLSSDVENKTLKISKMLDDKSETFKTTINGMRIFLYKKNNNFPIFSIKDGNLYGSIDLINFEKVNLNNNVIYSLKDIHFEKIIKASDIKYSKTLPTKEMVDTIINLNLN
jgi:hypothetical protein